MNELLKKVGEYLKTKKLFDQFDLTGMHGWNKQMDADVNQLIKDKKICCIETLGSNNNGVQQYQLLLSNNQLVYEIDSQLKHKAEDLLDQKDKYLKMQGYSKELKRYYDDINNIANELIAERNEFLNLNLDIVVAVITNSNLELANYVGRRLFESKMKDETLIDELLDIFSECINNLLKQ